MNQSLLYKLKSNFTFAAIFDYINDKSFMYKLLKYSNLCKKLNISKYDYYKVYFNSKELNLNNYLQLPSTENNLEKDLMKYKIEYVDFQKYVVCRFNEYELFLKGLVKKGELIDYRIDEKNININSQFFWALSEKDNFQLVFSILIPINTFKNNKIKNDYANIFKKMNESEFKYSSLKITCEGNEIDDLNNLNINFNLIKRLSICSILPSYITSIYTQYAIMPTTNYHNFNYCPLFEKLFSINNIQNNLVYLCLEIYKGGIVGDFPDLKLIKNLNNFIFLEELVLNGFQFKYEEPFELNLSNLKILHLICSKNISLANESYLKLRELNLTDGLILAKDSSPYYFPNLEKLIFNCAESNCYSFIYHLSDIYLIDFKKLKYLKYFQGYFKDFLELEYLSSLKTLFLLMIQSTREDEINAINKILSCKNLKDVSFQLMNAEFKDFQNIEGENNSVLNATIQFHLNKNNCIINNLLDKFLKLEKLNLILSGHGGKRPIDIEIEHNPNSKIREISLEMETDTISNIYGGEMYPAKPVILKIVFPLFENLIGIVVVLRSEIINLDQAFPFFNNNCKIIFKNLKYLIIENMSFPFNKVEYINNFAKNIDKFPNLKNLQFMTCVDDEFRIENYLKFIKKVLSIKLKILVILFRKNDPLTNKNDSLNNKNPSANEVEYSENELKIMFPNINYNNYNIIRIYKYS